MRPTMPPSASQLLRMALDEPFHDSGILVADLPLDCVVPSPIGDELVDSDDCRKETLVMDATEIRRLLRECDPQRHKTVRSMRAVKAP